MWVTGAGVKVYRYRMVISLQIRTVLNIFGQIVPKNRCGWKKIRIYKLQFCEVELDVLVDGVCVGIHS